MDRIKYFDPSGDSDCVVNFKDGEFSANRDCSISIGGPLIKNKIVDLKKDEKVALNQIKFEVK